MILVRFIISPCRLVDSIFGILSITKLNHSLTEAKRAASTWRTMSFLVLHFRVWRIWRHWSIASSWALYFVELLPIKSLCFLKMLNILIITYFTRGMNYVEFRYLVLYLINLINWSAKLSEVSWNLFTKWSLILFVRIGSLSFSRIGRNTLQSSGKTEWTSV